MVMPLCLHAIGDGLARYGTPPRTAVIGGPKLAAAVALAAEVRLLGVRSNAPLVARLAGLRGPPVQLWSPLVVPREARSGAAPDRVLHALHDPCPLARLPGSCHPLTADDACAYRIAAAVDAGETAAAVAALVRHAAWPALVFVGAARGRADLEAACRLVADVLDPRWFVHPARPGRLSRLNAYLGLSAGNAVAATGAAPGRNYFRYAAALRVWHNPVALASRVRGECVGPGDFLWRVCAAGSDRADGQLRATRKLVAFVYSTWYARVTGQPENGVFFFSRPGERDAYRAVLLRELGPPEKGTGPESCHPPRPG